MMAHAIDTSLVLTAVPDLEARVQAQTRQQWYPSLETHLLILIGPCIKGPEERPLKPRTAPIFMVDR